MTLDHINAACLFVLLSASLFQACGGPAMEKVKRGDAVVWREEFKTDVCGCGHCFCVFLFLCSLCPFEHAPRGQPAKKTLLLFTAGHGVCGIVHQAKSHRLAGVLLSAIESSRLSKMTLPNTILSVWIKCVLDLIYKCLACMKVANDLYIFF